MSRVTRSAGAARNRRRLPWVALGVFAVCVFGRLVAFPLVWFLVKE